MLKILNQLHSTRNETNISINDYLFNVPERWSILRNRSIFKQSIIGEKAKMSVIQCVVDKLLVLDWFHRWCNSTISYVHNNLLLYFLFLLQSISIIP